MPTKFVTGYPAAYVDDIKCLIISDLHIGLETELLRSGIKIHKQAEKFRSIIDKLIGLTRAETLIILGDIKHKVPGAYFQELRDISIFLEQMSARIEVSLIKGNHDDGIQTLIPKGVKLYRSGGFKIDKYGFFHGHAWPSKRLVECDYLFMGHLQPAVEFVDKLGYKSREQVWLKARLDGKLIQEKYKIKKTGKLNLIVVPAFNSLAGSLNVMGDKNLRGPLLTNNALNMGHAKPYLLDGTSLGEIRSLKKRFQKFLLPGA